MTTALSIKYSRQPIWYIVLMFYILSNTGIAQHTVVGYYYEGWGNTYPPGKIPYTGLTHINHAFAWPDSTGALSATIGIPDPGLNLAAHAANRKVLISLGGSEYSGWFGPVTADPVLRAKLISNIVSFISNNNYDGVDIDWEFPTAAQSVQLTQFVSELHTKFASVNSSWLITMAVPPTGYNGQYFQYENLSNSVDWFCIMAYDFYGSWSTNSGHNAPLYQAPDDYQGSAAFAVQYLSVTRNVPKSKLLLGLPFYGKEFNSAGLYKPATGKVTSLLYSDVAPLIASSAWQYYWDDVCKVPYLIDEAHSHFITFDDTVSIRQKVQYSIAQKLGGVMLWALGQDYYNGKQPLLEAIGKVMAEDTVSGVTQSLLRDECVQLYNNYPNPFNPSTEIAYSIPKGGFVTLFVYNNLGRKMMTLVSANMPKGDHKVSLNCTGLASGVYFYVLSCNGAMQMKKMMLLK